MSWRKLRGFILYISIALFALGLYWTITGGYWVLQRSDFFGKNEYLEQLTAWAGEWNFWFLALGLILLTAGAWYTVDTIKKRREFEKYINSDSKRKFTQNLRELEEIAYKLGDKYVERMEEKKREWKIKH
ncbi:MAG: DUF3198 domain-containing protein [Euryarchaeota archaeon]|nr:DUF3198 domain-containing protein [Euryarchaeota archaeon]